MIRVNDIMQIAAPLKDSGLLLKGVAKTTKVDFLVCY